MDERTVLWKYSRCGIEENFPVSEQPLANYKCLLVKDRHSPICGGTVRSHYSDHACYANDSPNSGEAKS